MRKLSSGTVCQLTNVIRKFRYKLLEMDSMKENKIFLCSLEFLKSLNKIFNIILNIGPWEARFLDVEDNSSDIKLSLIPRVANEASSEFLLLKTKSHTRKVVH